MLRRFQFSLRGVLQWHRVLEEQSRLELGAAFEQLAHAETRLSETERAIREAEEKVREWPQQRWRLHMQMYAEGLHRRRETDMRAVAHQEQQVERTRGRWMETRRNVKVMENLRERALAAHRAEEERVEQNEVDDMVAARWAWSGNLERGW